MIETSQSFILLLCKRRLIYSYTSMISYPLVPAPVSARADTNKYRVLYEYYCLFLLLLRRTQVSACSMIVVATATTTTVVPGIAVHILFWTECFGCGPVDK